MIKHIVMFKLKEADGRSEYENALEAQKRFESVIANVKELKKGEVQDRTCPETVKSGQETGTGGAHRRPSVGGTGRNTGAGKAEGIQDTSPEASKSGWGTDMGGRGGGAALGPA